MRRAHWLRPIASATFPRHLVVFDTETVPVQVDEVTTEQVLSFGWAAKVNQANEESWTEPEWFRFTDAVELWKWLESQCPPKHVLSAFCHNANFDWQVGRMTSLLPQLGWSCESMVFEDPPNLFTWRKDGKTLKLLDTFNYWRESVASLGERLGLAKLPFPENWDNTEISDAYCKRDVEILIKALLNWIQLLRDRRLGGLGISIAQQSWKAYTHRFMDAPIYIDDNEDALALSRYAYYGGRVECLHVNQYLSNVYGLDFNSMYPAIMRNESLPTRLHGVYKRVKLAELERWLIKYAVIAEVSIETNEPVYPVRTEGKLLFPIGTFVTYLTTPELLYALENNHIRQCHTCAIYDKARIFTRFVNELYSLRQEFAQANDEIMKYYIKILMNALYGKFGQRGYVEEIIGECDPSLMHVEDEIDLSTGLRYRNRYIAGKIISTRREAESRYSLPAIPAHITAYGRMMLWQGLMTAGPENTYYMDTDSLHVNARGQDKLQSLMSETELGKLKVEKRIASAIYYGPKDYELDGVRTIKGIRKTAVEVEPGTFAQDQWVSLRGAIAIGHVGGPLIRRVERSLAREYSKGHVTSSGRVRPWYIRWFK